MPQPPDPRDVIKQQSAPAAQNPAFPGQHEDEDIRFVFRQHPLVMRKALILGLLALLVVILPLDFPFSYEVNGLSGLFVRIDLYTLLVVLAYWVYRWSLWYYSVFIVTGERTVSIRLKSFFRREVNVVFHGSVHGVDYKVPGLQGALFGYGDISMNTWVGNFAIECVHKPADLHEKILQVIHDSRADGTGSM